MALTPLTLRELEVLRLTAQGCASPEMARRLGRAEATVKNQISSALQRLRARNRTHAVAIMDDQFAGWRDATSPLSNAALVLVLRAAADALELGISE